MTGITPSKSTQAFYGSEFPFFKPADLNDGYYVTKSKDGLSKEGINHARLLPEKSVLVTCIGATLGKTGLIRVKGASNQQINAIIPNRKIILPEYLYYWFSSSYGFQSVTKNASFTTLPILKKSKFEKVKIPLPKVEEQQMMLDVIGERMKIYEMIYEHVQNIIFRHKHNLALLSNLQKSVIDQTFQSKK